jgi:Domain of unknown function (DUF2019)
MSQLTLKKLTIEQLVERFVATALDQDRAIRADKNARFNRLYHQLDAIEDELKQRPGDQRRALIALLEHPNAEVRLRAAFATLALVPDLARKTLQNISDWNEYPQAPNARGMLRGLDDGSYTPT